jgi:hypothetical protein
MPPQPRILRLSRLPSTRFSPSQSQVRLL